MSWASADRRLIGRCVMVGVRGAAPGDPELEQDLAICAEACVGGVILFDVDLPTMSRLMAEGASIETARAQALRNIESPEQTRALVRHIRGALGDDVIIAIDHEGGETTRLRPSRGFDSTRSAADFGALAGAEQTLEAERLAGVALQAGVDLNFAPCVDLRMSPENPIIAGKRRAYGSDPHMVAQCAEVVVAAHRAKGMLTCLKHFPGHGGVLMDSHLALPEVAHRSMCDIELAPYQHLIPKLDPSTWIMTAHIEESDIDAALPASLSPIHTTQRLRRDLGFDGVIVTDSLDMGAIVQRWSIEDAAVLALQAGADCVLDGMNAPGERRACPALQIVEAIKNAVDDGRIGGGMDRVKMSADRIRRSRHAARGH